MDIPPGVYPAAVTPFGADGRPDAPAMARLLAYFEAAGCEGAVIAGTNGEGPSLSAPEKTGLLRDALAVRGRLRILLGVATPSLDEAAWLCAQAAKLGAAGALLMPPFYFRDPAPEGLLEWFERVLDAAPLPVVLYNFPRMTGAPLSPELVERLARRENFAGVKDSSGEPPNLRAYRSALPQGRALLAGDETLLVEALREGWTGAISGAANVLPQWLAGIAADWRDPATREAAETRFDLALPAIRALRALPQPAANKALLARLGVLPSAAVRLPLTPAPAEAVEDALDTIRRTLGVAPGSLGLSPPSALSG
jgi:4-hydroxy-tetrahydrodipicolinate synthase